MCTGMCPSLNTSPYTRAESTFIVVISGKHVFLCFLTCLFCLPLVPKVPINGSPEQLSELELRGEGESSKPTVPKGKAGQGFLGTQVLSHPKLQREVLDSLVLHPFNK